MVDRERCFLTARTYAQRVARLVPTALLSATLVAASGCGSSAKSSAPTGVYSTSTSTATTTTTGSIDPLPWAATTPVKGTAVGSETALLERIGVGRHEGYDRVVFQFKNALPGY